MIKNFKTQPEFIEVKDVNKTVIHLLFFMKHQREDIVKNLLMRRIITTCNKKIENTTMYRKRIDELLIMNFSVKNVRYVNIDVLDVYFALPRENIIEDFSLDDALEFLYDSLFNPLEKDGEFDLEHFNWERDFLLNQESDFPHSIGEYASEEFLKFFDEEKRTELTEDEYIKQLNEVNSSDTYNYYLKNIKNNHFKTYIYGNLENKDKILKTYNKYFKQDIDSFDIDIEYYDFLSLLDYKEKTTKIKYNQSVLNLFYQIDNLKEEDLLKFDMLYYFLNSKENDLIYDNLRNKNHLIYSAYMRRSIKYGVFGIRVFLSKEDIDNSLKIIDKTFDDIKNEDNFNIYKDRLLVSLQYDLYDEEDEPFSVVNKKINKDITIYYTLEEKLKLMKDITFKDMCEFIDRVKLTRKMTMIAGDKYEH